MQKIVAAIDFSNATEAVVSHAIAYAKALGASLDLLNVVFVPRDVVGGGMLYIDEEKIRQDLDRHAREEMAKWEKKVRDGGVEVVSHIAAGHPEVEIPAYAEKAGAGMLVIATHGRTGLAHLLIGSVAEKVVRTSKIPVLVVRAGVK